MTDDKLGKRALDRRSVLRASIGGAIGLLTGGVPAVQSAPAQIGSRRLSFRHLHTGERLSVTYRTAAGYDSEALAAVNLFLRDFRTGEKTEMDPDLLEFLFSVRVRLETEQPFEIISGYRSPATNARLAANSNGVAKRSYHMRGMAVDIRLPGRRLVDLRTVARDLRLGGVGFYRRSGFVHLDTGRVRFW